MKKKQFVLIALSLYALGVFAQFTVNTSSPQKYSKFEVNINLSNAYFTSAQRSLINSKNSYAKDEIQLIASLTDPNGNTRIINGFLHENFTVTNTSQTDPDNCIFPYIKKQTLSIPASGKQETWRIRFTPEITGTWTYSIKFSFPGSSSADISCGGGTFNCQNNSAKGFVKLENNIFKNSDGSGFIPLGLNIATWPEWHNEKSGTNFYDVFFDRLSEQGGNFARIFIDDYATLFMTGPYQWNDTPNMLYYKTFRQISSFQLDKIIEKAESLNIKLQICLNLYIFNSAYWDYNPYNKNNVNDPAHSGDCDSWEDILTKSTALKIQKDLVKYILDRWAYSKSVLSWEIVNEADVPVYNYATKESNIEAAGQRISAKMLTWHQTLISTIRSYDIYSHPITASFGDFNLKPYTGVHTEWWISDFNFNSYKNAIYNLVDYCDAHHYILPLGHGDPNVSHYPLVDEKDELFKRMNIIRQYIPNKQLAIGEHQVNLIENLSPKLEEFHELYDPGALSQHSSLWSTLFSGFVGPQSHWAWEHFIEKNNPSNISSNYMKCIKPISIFMQNMQRLDYSKQTPYHEKTEYLSTYYLSDKELNKVFGWVQCNNFSFEKLLGEYSVGTRGNNDGDFKNVSPYLTSGLITNKPIWSSNIVPRTFSINVPVSGKYEVTWYSSETGQSTGVTQTYNTCGLTTSLTVPTSLTGSKFGDIAFIAVLKEYGEPQKSYQGISNPLKDYSEIETNSANQVIYKNSSDNKISASYQNNGIWSTGALITTAPMSYSYTGFAVDAGSQSPIYYSGFENNVKNFYKIYWDGSWKLTKLTNANININTYSEIKYYDNHVIYVMADRALGSSYNCTSTYWCDGYLNQSAPKVYQKTGFDIIRQWNLPIFYAGDNVTGGTDIYKMYWDNTWKYERITTSGNLNIHPYSEIHLGYNNTIGFYVRNDGYICAFYTCGGSSWCVDWIHPTNAPKVKLNTGFSVSPTWDNHIFYIGEDNKIYEIYYNGSWTFKEVVYDLCFSGVKNYSDLLYSNNTLFFGSSSDNKIHYLFNNNSVFKSAQEEPDELKYFDNYRTEEPSPEEISGTYINVFPNPSNGKFMVASIENIQSLKLLDCLGKVYFSMDNINENLVDLNLNGLDNGLFFIRCELNNGRSETIKIVINK